MLNVTESANGKYNIVLSDGYKSQLHDRGKVKTKTDLVSNDLVGKTKPRGKVQDSQSKQNKERSNKGPKLSRVAAKFNGKLPDNKPKPTVQKSGNSSETTAFVTKNDLAKLLETLNQSNVDNVPAIQNDTQLELPSYPGPSNKDTHLTQINTKKDEKTKEMNTGENLQVSEKVFNKLESIAPQDVKEDNHEETVTKEIIKPAAMRSSFAIGAPGLVANNTHDDKAAKHRQWVKELEQQIQEKKEREKQIKRNQSVDLSYHQPIESERLGSLPNKPNNESHQSKTTATLPQFQQETDRSSAGHARGRGLMNMLSESEADKQRKKIIQHQKAIEVQVEERRQQKMAERERRLREEAIEDERVAKEREKLQKQFEEEVIKMKEKEEQAKRRAQLLQEGISKAFASSQQLKRDKRKSHLQESTTEVSVHHDAGNFGKTHAQQAKVSHDESSRPEHNNKHIVPPLNLRTSVSPVNKSNGNFSSRLSDPTLNVKRNSLISERDVKTSYSEADKDRSETLINKWVNEDFSSTNREHDYDRRSENLSSEVIVPFHRTASATLFRESLDSQDINESKNVSEFSATIGNISDPRIRKKGRSVPEVQTTRTSRLREKGTDSKNSSITSRRQKHGVEGPQQTVQKSKPRALQETNDDRYKNKYNNISSSGQRNETTTIPSHLLATFTPTAHQEKILEQLAALRKGLLVKDQEIKTRVFQINEHEIQA